MSFIEHLSPSDHERLRLIARRIVRQQEHRTPENIELDQLIETFGPETIERLLRKAAKTGLTTKKIFV